MNFNVNLKKVLFKIEIKKQKQTQKTKTNYQQCNTMSLSWISQRLSFKDSLLFRTACVYSSQWQRNQSAHI